jgi:hypothetical protein
MWPAFSCVNYIYICIYMLQKLHNNSDHLVYHLLFFVYLLPDNHPTITGVATCHRSVGRPWYIPTRLLPNGVSLNFVFWIFTKFVGTYRFSLNSEKNSNLLREVIREVFRVTCIGIRLQTLASL